MFGKKKKPEEEFRRIELQLDETPDGEKDEVSKKTPGAGEEEVPAVVVESGEQIKPEETKEDTAENLQADSKETEDSGLAPEETEDTEPAAKRKSFGRHIKRIFLIILILAASVAMTFAYSMWREYNRKESVEGNEISIEIPKGTSTREVAAILREKGVIRYETPFLIKMYFSEYRGKLRYGTFTVNDGLCLDDLISRLATEGALKDESSFTVPEGYSVEMIAEKLEKEDFMSADEFITAVNDAAAGFKYADQLPAADQVFYQLQGYLFPNTYHISDNMTGDQLVARMLKEFDKKFDSQRQAEAEKAGLTMEEVLIRASLVQKETEKADEYAMIAGVINNRLARDMKLQFDSSTVYALTNGLFGIARVTYEDLKLESPYNTYYVKGLPPGPICNPGIEAIDGVLHAKDHSYLYFQMDSSKNDGSNLFFETYEEHKNAQATTGTEDQTDQTDEKKSADKSDNTEQGTEQADEGEKTEQSKKTTDKEKKADQDSETGE
ncbi:MAG: endolytic transglycosylase MltG [Eubacterium sp.]|nr:endolytic transglycosylase MltG [Eubacterium sp.]